MNKWKFCSGNTLGGAILLRRVEWVESVFIFNILSLRYLLDNLVEMSNYAPPEGNRVGAGKITLRVIQYRWDYRRDEIT